MSFPLDIPLTKHQISAEVFIAVSFLKKKRTWLDLFSETNNNLNLTEGWQNLCSKCVTKQQNWHKSTNFSKFSWTNFARLLAFLFF